MSDLDGITSLAARLRAIPTLGATIAQEAAPDLLALNKASAADGTTPDGKAWAPTKKGARALVHAADALSSSVAGDVVYLELTGINVFHNATRRIVPYKGIGFPASYRDAIQAAATRVIGRAP